MPILSVRVPIGKDEIGLVEECSWDLIPVVHPDSTKHLDNDGLPRKGTVLRPGMILIGKLGKTGAYATSRKPTALELQALGFDELREQFGHLWVDRCAYVVPEMAGQVVDAVRQTNSDGSEVAVVAIETAVAAAPSGQG